MERTRSCTTFAAPAGRPSGRLPPVGLSLRRRLPGSMATARLGWPRYSWPPLPWTSHPLLFPSSLAPRRPAWTVWRMSAGTERGEAWSIAVIQWGADACRSLGSCGGSLRRCASRVP